MERIQTALGSLKNLNLVSLEQGRLVKDKIMDFEMYVTVDLYMNKCIKIQLKDAQVRKNTMETLLKTSFYMNILC